MDAGLIVALVLAFVAITVIVKTAVVVPQQNAYIVESLGKYSRTLESGFALLIPFVERIAYRHSLKERAIDVEEQVCITADNVQVGVDGVLYLQVMDARKASYGIGNYLFAIAQLAQTTLRSEIGKIELDKTFEERSHINLRVVEELDQASNPWGVKVLRYEIKNINPPRDVLTAIRFMHRFLSDRPWAVAEIARLLRGQSGFSDERGDILKGKFDYLRDRQPASVYADILTHTLHATAPGGLHLCDIAGAEGATERSASAVSQRSRCPTSGWDSSCCSSSSSSSTSPPAQRDSCLRAGPRRAT